MKFLRILVTLVLLMPFSVAGEQGADGQECSSCAVVAQALNDSRQIKIGMPRRAVEQYFQRNGGAQFPDSTRYVYMKCNYLHLDVQFELKRTSGQLFSADDSVVSVSKLYIDYSTKD